MADARPDGARIDTTPAAPKPPRPLIDAAGGDISKTVADTPQRNGSAELVASALAKKLQAAGHVLAAAQWAIHEAIVAGKLKASPTVFIVPERIVTESERQRESLFPKRSLPATPIEAVSAEDEAGPLPFHRFKVAATEKLWECWEEPKSHGGVGGQNSPETDTSRNDPTDKCEFSHNSDFLFDTVRDAIQAVKGYLADRFRGEPSSWPAAEFNKACGLKAAERAKIERHCGKSSGWLNDVLDELSGAKRIGRNACVPLFESLNAYEGTLYRARQQAKFDDAEAGEETAAPRKSVKRKRPGRPGAKQETIEKEARIAEAWKRAREARVYKPKFAKDNALTVKQLDALLDRVDKRKQRSDK